MRGLGGALENDGSALHQATGVVGPAVSGVFLLLIGLLNLAILLSIVRIFRRLRQGEFDEAGLEAQLASRGLHEPAFTGARRGRSASRGTCTRSAACSASASTPRPRSALLVLAGGAAASGLPFYAILCLPILFAAGMSLFDTIDGAFMNFAYGWAFSQPVRKLFYNLTVTGLSVAVALVIGSIELLGVLADSSLIGGLGPRHASTSTSSATSWSACSC